jgi:hypothetical protein
MTVGCWCRPRCPVCTTHPRLRHFRTHGTAVAADIGRRDFLADEKAGPSSGRGEVAGTSVWLYHTGDSTRYHGVDIENDGFFVFLASRPDPEANDPIWVRSWRRAQPPEMSEFWLQSSIWHLSDEIMRHCFSIWAIRGCSLALSTVALITCRPGNACGAVQARGPDVFGWPGTEEQQTEAVHVPAQHDAAWNERCGAPGIAADRPLSLSDMLRDEPDDRLSTYSNLAKGPEDRAMAWRDFGTSEAVGSLEFWDSFESDSSDDELPAVAADSVVETSAMRVVTAAASANASEGWQQGVAARHSIAGDTRGGDRLPAAAHARVATAGSTDGTNACQGMVQQASASDDEHSTEFEDAGQADAGERQDFGASGSAARMRAAGRDQLWQGGQAADSRASGAAHATSSHTSASPVPAVPRAATDHAGASLARWARRRGPAQLPFSGRRGPSSRSSTSWNACQACAAFPRHGVHAAVAQPACPCSTLACRCEQEAARMQALHESHSRLHVCSTCASTRQLRATRRGRVHAAGAPPQALSTQFTSDAPSAGCTSPPPPQQPDRAEASSSGDSGMGTDDSLDFDKLDEWDEITAAAGFPTSQPSSQLAPKRVSTTGCIPESPQPPARSGHASAARAVVDNPKKSEGHKKGNGATAAAEGPSEQLSPARLSPASRPPPPPPPAGGTAAASDGVGGNGARRAGAAADGLRAPREPASWSGLTARPSRTPPRPAAATAGDTHASDSDSSAEDALLEGLDDWETIAAAEPGPGALVAPAAMSTSRRPPPPPRRLPAARPALPARVASETHAPRRPPREDFFAESAQDIELGWADVEDSYRARLGSHAAEAPGASTQASPLQAQREASSCAAADKDEELELALRAFDAAQGGDAAPHSDFVAPPLSEEARSAPTARLMLVRALRCRTSVIVQRACGHVHHVILHELAHLAQLRASLDSGLPCMPFTQGFGIMASNRIITHR